MKATTRTVVESPLWQGQDEEIAYSLTTTPWNDGGSPSSASCTIYNNATNEDLTATNLEAGTVTPAGDVLTSAKVINLTPGTEYRLEFQWVVSGNTLEVGVIINGQR